MKLFLFLVLFSFSAYAQTGGTDLSGVMDIINENAPSVFKGYQNIYGFQNEQVYVESMPYCIENNMDNCKQLGYTTEKTDLGGRTDCVACPFDENLFNCPEWTCAEVGLLDYEKIPEGMACKSVEVPGNENPCYQCYCGIGYINYSGCEGLIAEQSGRTADEGTNKTKCESLGYKDSVTDCADYVPCPLNQNRVRCLDVVICNDKEECPEGEESGSSLCANKRTCAPCKETGCISEVEIPDNAEPAEEVVKECSCHATDETIVKKVVKSWKCKAGYYKVQENGKDICVAVDCGANEYEGPDATELVSPEEYKLEDCYKKTGNSAPGWKKVAVDKGNGKTCYKCECNLPTNCTYNAENAGKYGKLEGLCCDGVSYTTCMKNCPSDVFVPDNATKEQSHCKACGDDKMYTSGWHCNTGYVRNDNRCDVKLCSDYAGEALNSTNAGEKSYYDIAYNDYTKASDCRSIIDGDGWELENGQDEALSTGEGDQGCKVGQSGLNCCGRCICPASIDSVYQYALSDTYNSAYAKYENLGCNGKYQKCTPMIEGLGFLRQQELQGNFAAAVGNNYEPTQICGDTYYYLKGCNNGYTLASNRKKCEPTDCSAYNIPGDTCPAHGHCQTCNSAGVISSMLTRCDTRLETGGNIEYAIDATRTECCQKTCDINDNHYIIGTECPSNKRLDESAPVIENGCHETCVRCI